MKILRFVIGCFFVLMALAGGLGCKTAESENRSERPWNAPTTWEHGLPGFNNQGR